MKIMSNRSLAAWCLALLWAGFSLSGCSKKDEEPSPLGHAVIQQIERPINRTRQAEDAQAKAAADARKKIDEATQ
jgi:uncharacterized membrane protein YccC